MLRVSCPFCGPRDESEFFNGGPSRPKRTDSPDELSDSEWVDYLTVTANPLGPVTEEWWHVRGCSQWFAIRRDTVTHEILGPASD
jgi:sarcosine oxidase, subunit delta